MNNSEDVINFIHSGLSPVEVESVYGILTLSMYVSDEPVDSGNDLHKSILTIKFPFIYGETLFQIYQEWARLKRILKEMRRRRGRKGFIVTLVFLAEKSEKYIPVWFTLDNLSERDFERGIEKLEYASEIIVEQIAKNDSKSDVYLRFDGMKWKIINN